MLISSSTRNRSELSKPIKRRNKRRRNVETFYRRSLLKIEFHVLMEKDLIDRE